MPKLCPCGSTVYTINSFYPKESELVCISCNHSIDLCICKALESELTEEELDKSIELLVKENPEVNPYWPRRGPSH